MKIFGQKRAVLKNNSPFCDKKSIRWCSWRHNVETPQRS